MGDSCGNFALLSWPRAFTSDIAFGRVSCHALAHIEDPKDTKYSWEDFRADLNTYKTIGLVLATTLMPNVLSETQVEAGGIMALREMQRKQAAELADTENIASKEIKRRVVGLVEELVKEKII